LIKPPLFTNQAVAVLGLGRSGMAAAASLLSGGLEVRAWDDARERRDAACAAGIPVVDLNRHGFANTSTLVLSPGIPHSHPRPHPLVEKAQAAGCEILCDIELLARACPKARFIGITGTNGKSTVTALLGHILRDAGRRAEVGGNIGAPALTLAPMGSEGIYVLELSSYQLELLPTLTFDIAVLLNLGIDHLERHGGLGGYQSAKRRIFRNQKSGQTTVIGIDDEPCRKIYHELTQSSGRSGGRSGGARVIPIAGGREAAGGVYARDGDLIDAIEGPPRRIFNLSGLKHLPGAHNRQNAAAAYAVARTLGIEPERIAESITSFGGLPHRQEQVALIDGVAYVNDSKATNAEATARAIACYDRIHWIAGGQAKTGGIEPLKDKLDVIAHAYLIGDAQDCFATLLGERIPWTRCGDLETAVRSAHKRARTQVGNGGPAPTVLLSPACASFDQWTNFEERGEAFRNLVAGLSSAAGAGRSGKGDKP
jgi:UDP-N-acetylmuramoylalanine--D-glutamate ligase